MHTEQRLCVAAATRSDPWHSLPITLSSTYQSFSLFIPLPANAHIGVLCCLCTQTCTHALTVTCQYLWGFLLAVVPERAWLLGSVCLVLIWLHKLHQRRGFTLNRIFGLFIGWTLHAESYLMSHVLEDRKGSDLSWAWLNVYVRSFWMSVPMCLHECMWGHKSPRQESQHYLRIFGLFECVVLGIYLLTLLNTFTCVCVWQGLKQGVFKPTAH